MAIRLVNRCLARTFATAATVGGTNIFDRRLKRRQRDWAAVSDHFDDCQYLKDEIAYR